MTKTIILKNAHLATTRKSKLKHIMSDNDVSEFIDAEECFVGDLHIKVDSMHFKCDIHIFGDVLHRNDGPAIYAINSDGSRKIEFYLAGVRYTPVNYITSINEEDAIMVAMNYPDAFK